MKRKFSHLALLLFLFSLWGTLKGQVTIGDGVAPQKFSMLEIVSKNKGGLRLPHLTTAQRNTLSATSEFDAEHRRGDNDNDIPPGLGLGLTIYNTDTNCTEYWNGYKWVSLCLGTANIVLKSPCGDYDPQKPPTQEADGELSSCEYTPDEEPACVVPSGKAYDVYLTVGATYANLQVDELTSAFSISFLPNNSSLKRNAVVRVVNNCTGEFKDFVFPQEGAKCAGGPDPVPNAATFLLCAGGSVFVHVTNAVPGVDYVWTYAGVIVHTGNWYEIRRAGTYKVYTGLLGCGTPAEITVTGSSTTAPAAVAISATNGGVLCSGGNVFLTANTAQTVLWYQNGIPLSGGDKNNNPLLLSDASDAGQWFAAVVDGDCVSNSSNVLTLIDNTAVGLPLDLPEAEVNGQPLSSGSLTICKGGTLKLEVANASAYSPGTQYEWFNNDVPVAKGTDPVMYLVPANTDNMVLSVTVSNLSGSCPNTVVSPKTPVTAVAPGATSINYGAAEAAICGGTPATLIADHTVESGGEYEWMRDGLTVPGNGQTLKTNIPGKYTVRYKNAANCWSVISVPINVIQSATLNMSWNIEPQDVVNGDQVTYAVISSPAVAQYQWSYDSENENAVVSFIPIGNGTSAVVQYGVVTLEGGAPIPVELVVRSVGHPCGDVTLKKTIAVKNGCTPGTSVNLIPNGTISMTAGKPITFSASSNASNNEGDLKYEWSVNGVPQDDAPEINTFTYTPVSPGQYTVSVEVTNKCTDAGDLTAEAILNVKADPGAYTPDDSGNFKLTGKYCFDIAQSNFGSTCGTQAQRPGDFLDGNRNWVEGRQWVYTFTAASGSTYTNLQFVTDDPSVLIKSETSNTVNTHTLVFDESVLTKALGKNKANALNITVHALFEVGNLKKRVSLNIRVQDCLCGCEARISPTVWKVFMCHNLGADETLDPLTPAANIHGAKYKFGAKNASVTMERDQDNTPITNWKNSTLYPYQSDNKDWDMENNNPCPAGFRVPTSEEWKGVIKYNNPTYIGTWVENVTNYSSGVKFGDELFLPAAGTRYHETGAVSHRGYYGYYWSSTSSGTGVNRLSIPEGSSNVFPISQRNAGYSVRCIAKD
jgi:uncharacterized protein (TIGR02145 family)